MKISVNLATISSPRERYALAWALPLAVAAAISLVMLSYSVARSYLDYRKIERQTAALLQQKQALTDRENALKKNLEQPRERAVFRKVQFVNGLIDEKQLSLTQITETVSKLLPPNVRLASMALTHAREETQVRFQVVGKSEEALEEFLGKLEDSSDFQDFSVSSQGFQRAETNAAGVSISCTARYVGAGAN
jgi:Tfp pilus assembly protein PilN